MPELIASHTAERLQALHQQGFVLLPGVLEAPRIAALRTAIDALRPIHWDYQGSLDHYKCLFNRDPFWLSYLDLPQVIELAEAALGEDCHVIGQTAWRCHPGFVGSALHLDHLPMALPPSLLDDPTYLDDIDAELAPTRVIPGSHRAGRPPAAGERHWRGREPEPIFCRAGDLLFFRSELWHAGSPNLSRTRSRYLLQIHYGRRMVAQKFSPYLHFRFDPAVLAACTPRQRRLLGDHAEAEYD
jgi:ectoine hydroxylase-related dioxygenase (phytanoyl-CoA dioxygenase family)